MDHDTLGSGADLRARLASTLDKEAELLTELSAVFSVQREAVACGDAQRLDDGVFAATRLMRTLEAARSARRSLTLGLVGSELDFIELEAVLTGAENRPVRSARESVLEAAALLRREVRVLRGALSTVLDDNRRCLDVLLSPGEGARPARVASATESSPAPLPQLRSVVDRRV